MAGIQQNDVISNVLECPVCYEVPKSSPIYQCDYGHHICESCYSKMRVCTCPICKAQYYGTRNFLAEELIKKFTDLRVAFSIPAAIVDQEKNSRKRLNVAPPNCRGNFQCLFVGCNKLFCAGNMLSHIRHSHFNSLIELSSREKYSESWKFKYMLNVRYVQAIRIANMGLFFLTLKIGGQGLVYAGVQMVASEEVTRMFTFKIKVLDAKNKTKISFKERVFSCRDKLEHLLDKGHCLVFDANVYAYWRTGGNLRCCVSIIDGRH